MISSARGGEAERGDLTPTRLESLINGSKIKEDNNETIMAFVEERGAKVDF